MEEKIELMDSRMKDLQGFDDISASQRDLLPGQLRMGNDGWLVVVDIHLKAYSMTATSSLWELVNVLPVVLRVANTSGCVRGPLVTTAATPPFLVPSADPSVYMVWSAWYDAICVTLYWCFEAVSSAQPAIPGTKVKIYSLRGVLNCQVDGAHVQLAKVWKDCWSCDRNYSSCKVIEEC